MRLLQGELAHRHSRTGAKHGENSGQVVATTELGSCLQLLTLRTASESHDHWAKRGPATEPWIDVKEIAHEVGNFAGVYLMTAGDHTWSFARNMMEGTQVFGGAGRVYPVGAPQRTDRTRPRLHAR